MTIEELLKKNLRESNFEAFCDFLFDSDVNYVFRSFCYLPFDNNKVNEKVKLFQYEGDGFYFILNFEGCNVLIYNIDILSNKIKDCYLLDSVLFKRMIVFMSESIDLKRLSKIIKSEKLE